MLAGLDAVAGGEGAAGHGEVVVGEEEPHAGAGGDAEDFFEVVGHASGEETARKFVELSRLAEEVDGLVEVVSRFGRAGGMGAAERKVVEADVEETSISLGPFQSLGGPAEDFCSLGLTEKEIAIPMSPGQVEKRACGLSFPEEPFGFREEALGSGEVTRLMEGVCEVGAPAHPMGPLGSAAGEIDRLPARGDSFWYVAGGEVEPADVAVTDGRDLPILQLHSGFGCGQHRRDGVG